MARLASQVIVSFLTQTAVFKAVPPEVLAKLALYVEQQETPRGKPLLPSGAVVTTLGVLYTGRASMQIVDVLTGTKTALEEIYPGDVFGEVGLVLGAASPLAVIAEEDCESLVIQKAHFDKICAAVPDALHAVAKQIGARFLKVSLVGGKRTVTRAAEPEPASSANVASSPGRAATGPLPNGALPFVEVASFQVGPKLLDLIPARVMLEQRLLPLETKGRTLVVGMVNPHSARAKDELRLALHSVDPEIVAISADDFANTVTRLKIDTREARGGAGAAAGPASRALKPQYAADVKKDAEKGVQVMIGDEVVQLLDRILGEAVERGASDIHIEPEAVGLRVRYRLQGSLVERKEMTPVSYAGPLAARVKVLSELDITERRMPQDGRIAASFGTRELNFRVSTMPVARGEKIVIRILDPGDVMRPLEHIFLDPRQLELIQRAIGAAHGAIMLAGATGSGKSSTLYSLLNARKLSRPDNNIVTVEDPVEFLVAGLSQSGLNPKTGLSYPMALRGLMRQDPDVIMVGELRDEATAQMMVEAALTGHLVLSTMHGSNIGAVFQRLEHFGIASMQIGQAMNAVIVQKLARKLCSACAREEEVSPQLAEVLLAKKLIQRGAAPVLPRAVGCDACNASGYRGRVAAHEMLFFSDEVKFALEQGASQSDVLGKAEKAGNFFNFGYNARLLMGRRAITPADALQMSD